MNNKKLAEVLRFKLVQDTRTNLIHLGDKKQTRATCNSRYVVTAYDAGWWYADDFACVRCLKKLDKFALTEIGQRRIEREARRMEMAKRKMQRVERSQARDARRTAKAAVRTQREAMWFGDMNVKREARKLWKLLETYHGGKPMPTNFKLEVHKGQRKIGYAKFNGSEVMLRRTGDVIRDWETLAHELVHVAVKYRKVNGNYKMHDKVFYDALRDITQRRWKTQISFYHVSKYGYEVDRYIEKQLKEAGVVKFKPRPTKEEVA